MSDRCCDVLLSTTIRGRGRTSTSIIIDRRLRKKIGAKGDLLFQINKEVNLSLSFGGKSSLKTKLSTLKGLTTNFSGYSKIKSYTIVDKDLTTNIVGTSKVKGGLDKFYGEFVDTSEFGKLFPSNDRYISNFKSVNGDTDSLYDNINEGVFYGDYATHGKYSEIFYNDEDYIITDKRRAEGIFGLENPLQTFRDSYFILRAASNSSFKIHNIELEDKIGRTVCLYPDIVVSGDNEFTTYSFKADPNYAALNTYEDEYLDIINIPAPPLPIAEDLISNTDNLDSYAFESPVINGPDVFKIKFKVSINDSDPYSSFNEFFDDDFDDSDFGYRYLKISALEICNKTDGGVREDGYIPFYLQAPDKGFRLNTCISPISREEDIFIFDISKKICGEYHRDGYYNKGFSEAFLIKKGCNNKNIWFNAEEVYLKAFFTGTGVVDVICDTNDGLLNEKSSFATGSKMVTPGINIIPLTFDIDNKARPTFGKFIIDLKLGQGVEVSKLELCISHGPSNAIKLETLGGDLYRICRDNEFSLLTSKRKNNNDPFINKGVNFSRVSLIENIPHEYSNPDTLRTNYARRWTGIPGNVKISPFKPSEFDISFEFEQPNSPFLLGHYTFVTSGNQIIPKVGDPISYIGIEDNLPLRNLGLRIKPKDRLQNSVHSYDSIDWSSDITQYSVTDSFDGTTLPISGFLGSDVLTSGDIVLPDEFQNIASSGFSLYLKFSLPEFDIYNAPSLLTNRDILLSTYNISDNTVSSNFNIWLNKRDNQITGLYSYPFPTPFKSNVAPINFSKQFPFHLLITFNEPLNNNDVNSNRIKFYWMYDGEDLIHTNPPHQDVYLPYLNVDTSSRKFFIRTANIMLHELAFSTNNLVGKAVDPDKYEESISRFLRGRIMYWDQPYDRPEDDKNYLPSFINTKTSDWHMGDFKFAHFNNAQFDIMKKRPSKEFLSFDIYGSGSPYGNELSYDSQIENDFLRFNIEDPEEKIFGVPQRISKDIMDNYVFNRRGIVAETIIDYSQEGEIIWADGKLGPKMIVTLFSDALGASESGIINKKEFYLDPYISWEKLECTFDPEDYWGYNKPNLFIEEFSERILNDNMEQMFIQYDLKIPTSDFYRSKINIHAANVTLKCPLLNPSDIFNSVNIYASGNYSRFEFLDLNFVGHNSISGELPLYTSGEMPENQSIDLLCSGDFIEYGLMPLFHCFGNATPLESGLNLISEAVFVADDTLNLHTYYDYDSFPQDKFLSLYSYSTEYPSIRSRFNLVSFSTVADKPKDRESLNLLTRSFATPDSIYRDGALNLFTVAPKTPSDRINLYIEGAEKTYPFTSSSLNFHVISYPLVYIGNFGKIYFAWTTQDIGRGVQAFDEDKLSIPSTDQIRDQEGICYGECGCKDDLLTTHSINWYGETCETGGLARPFRFNNSLLNPLYPDGFFYGARKYTGLIPNSKYSVRFSAITGSIDPIELPREFEEWEYGTLGDIDYNPNYVVTSGDSKAVKTMDNKLFTSYPYATLYEDREIEKAGVISLYERTELSGSGDKSSFEFKENITLPEGMKGDFYYELPGKFIAGYGEIPKRKWNIGQEGREFGYSMDVAKNGDREILVVGAPKAKWNRQFEEVETSGVNVALMVFTDEYKNFSYSASNLQDINLILKYFAANPTNINLKPVIYHPVGITELNEFNTGFITRKALPRNILNRPYDMNIINESAQIIREGIDELFPYNENERHNNIPIILMAYIDNSRSLGRSVIEPALTKFFSSFKEYSLASGVQDVYGTPKESYTFEKILPKDVGEDHNTIATEFIDEILSTGNLLLSGASSLFTSGIGPQFVNTENIEFNIPPESGGRVYIFEKEFGDWNLIQEIKLNDLAYDMFGHSVSISKDSYNIAIGSPHASENCLIFKYQDNAKNAVYSNVGKWLEANNRPEYEEYLEIRDVSGVIPAGKEIYKILSKKDRFYIRADEKIWRGNPINEFIKVQSDGVDGIGGEFSEIPLSGAGNPRLGYSSAINDDGSLVVFGAPTDSLGLYSNADFYFRHDGYNDPDNDLELIPSGTWNSYVNAGSVRIYEKARKTYPTIDANGNSSNFLEYGRFGNLSRSLGFTSYDNQGNEKNSSAINDNNNYSESGFNEFRIPDETPVLFIVTPEVDATNDQVMGEIKRWMSLGDRKLVLVGDDPIWEANGAYAISNQIINKILDKLDSRMRLVPARNSREALMENNNYDPDNLPINVIKSFKPEGSRGTEINHDTPLHGYGTADIKFFSPNTTFTPYSEYILEENIKKAICSEYNKDCKLPIVNYGDLRAEWTERGIRFPPPANESQKYVFWKRNLGFEYGSQGFPQISEQDRAELEKSRNIKIPGCEPSPLMVAATYEERTLINPGSPPTSSEFPIYEKVCYPKNTELFFFNDEPLDDEDLWMEWSFDKQDYSDIDYNYYIIPPEEIEPLFDPDPLFDRDAVLQGKHIGFEGDVTSSADLITLDLYSNIVARQDIGTSTVYLIASTSMEEEYMLEGEDQNISFYDNLVRFNTFSSSIFSVVNSNIAQLSGWTGANSFNTFVKDSKLKNVLISRGHSVLENAGSVPTSSSNVAWIANTPNLPSQNQANQIINWLNLGNRRLVITYDGTEDRARNIRDLCNMLGLKIRPWQLPDNKMARNTDKTDNKLKLSTSRETYPLNENDWVTKVFFEIDFVPIEIQEGMRILYQEVPVTYLSSTINQEPDVLKMRTGVSWTRFPAIPGSGYEVTYRWYSDFINESEPLDLFISNVVIIADDPEKVEAKNIHPVVNYNKDNNEQEVARASYKDKLVASIPDIVYEKTVKVQLDKNYDYLDFFVTGNKKDVLITNTNPYTCKLFDIVIKPVPINNIISSKSECFDKIVGYDVIINPGTDDEEIVLPPKLYAFTSSDLNICPCPKGLIEDGPVMIAEEIESFSSFSSGSRRSSIVLIADSTLVNGRNENQTDGTENNYSGPALNNSNVNGRINNFINSLLKNDSNALPNIEYQPYIRLVSPEIMGGIYGVGIGGGSTNSDPNLHVTHYDYKEEFIIPHNWPEETKEEALERVIREFEQNVGIMGITPKFKFGGYEDIPYSGVGTMVHKLMEEEGKDFLDKEFMFDKYLGDLFGYSVSINGNKIFVGTPMDGWKNGNINVNESGGGGAIFTLDKDPVSGWRIYDKLKPNSINPKDRFGYSTSSSSDLVVVGAPGHDYGVNIEYRKGNFVRKEFTSQFEIGFRKVYDIDPNININNGETFPVLGLDSSDGASNQYFEDIGAIYTYQNKLIDFNNRIKKWKFIEKVSPPSGQFFGENVHIFRNYRSDSDYALASTIENSGINAYVYDGMLRRQPPSLVSPEATFNASIFGAYKNNNTLTINIENLSDLNSEKIEITGEIYSDEFGQILLEVSGIDTSKFGFMRQRPYVNFVFGEVHRADIIEDNLNFFVDGGPFFYEDSINLYSVGPDFREVYNSLDIFTKGNQKNEDMNLYLDCSGFEPTSGNLLFYTSGIGIIDDTFLNLRIRGK